MLLVAIDDFLRGRGRFSVGAPLVGRLAWFLGFVLTFGVLYGAVMGSFSGLSEGRLHQLLYSGAKVPLLLLVTFLICLPSFFVINTVAGLREDFGQAVQALVATQSCVTIVLACLAPVTAFFYLSITSYQVAVLFNSAIFAAASITSQVVLRRYYAPLIRRSPKHRAMLYFWGGLYVFVGIQMGWVLRPFIGDPDSPVRFFRSDAWGNAYVVLGRLVVRTWTELSGG